MGLTEKMEAEEDRERRGKRGAEKRSSKDMKEEAAPFVLFYHKTMLMDISLAASPIFLASRLLTPQEGICALQLPFSFSQKVLIWLWISCRYKEEIHLPSQ